MNPIYVSLVELVGALIGSLSSIVVMLIQARMTERRERIRQAMTLALEDLKLQVQHAQPGTAVLPISIYLHQKMEIIKAIEENDLTPDRIRRIAKMNDALIEAMKELEERYRSRIQMEREKRAAERAKPALG